jgi:hypothetical protein
VFGAVERIAGVLESFSGVAGGEMGFGEREAEVDRVLFKAAGVSEEDAGFAFGDGLGVVSQMAVEFAGRVEAAKLEIDVSRTAGESAGVLQASGGTGRIIRKEELGEKSVGAAESVVVMIAHCKLPVGLRLSECAESVTAKKLSLSLTDAQKARHHGLGARLTRGSKVGYGCDHVSQAEVRCRAMAESVPRADRVFRLRGKCSRTFRVTERDPEVCGVLFDVGEVPGPNRFLLAV